MRTPCLKRVAKVLPGGRGIARLVVFVSLRKLPDTSCKIYSSAHGPLLRVDSNNYIPHYVRQNKTNGVLSFSKLQCRLAYCPSLNYGAGWASYLCGLGEKNGRPGGRFVPNFPHEPGFNPRRRAASVRGAGQNDHFSRGVLHQPLCSRIDRLKEIQSKLESHAYFGDPTGVLKEREGVPVWWTSHKPLRAAAFLQEVLDELHTRCIHMSVGG